MRAGLALLLLLATALRVQADEMWNWAALDLWQQPGRKAWLFLGNRLDTVDGPTVQIVSPRFRQSVQPWLDFGLGLSVLSIENTTTNERRLQLRPELELNPRFELTPHLTLEWRNRFEWRMNEGEAFRSHRLRHRLQLSADLPQPLGPVTRFFFSNEWFIDLQRRDYTENRAVPLGLTLRMSPHVDLDLFYMIVSTMPVRTWQHESVFGTYLRVHF